MLVRTPAARESEISRFVQTRLQRSLTRTFDVALEGRRTSARGTATNVAAAEFGGWIGGQLRAAIGYSTAGFANPGSVLRSTSSRGGAYVVLSTSLFSRFDLMGSN